MRAFDAMLGDTSRLVVVTRIHLLALAWIVAIALLSMRERGRADRDLPLPYPNWPLLRATPALIS